LIKALSHFGVYLLVEVLIERFEFGFLAGCFEFETTVFS
jgi:hypothetical protein